VAWLARASGQHQGGCCHQTGHRQRLAACWWPCRGRTCLSDGMTHHAGEQGLGSSTTLSPSLRVSMTYWGEIKFHHHNYLLEKKACCIVGSRVQRRGTAPCTSPPACCSGWAGHSARWPSPPTPPWFLSSRSYVGRQSDNLNRTQRAMAKKEC